MKTIAIYGKGGIGKSTVASNLTACFASLGFRVMQIGCDPKHDSTQMLCGSSTTLLDIIKQKGAEICDNDIVHIGCLDTLCVEIGGPQPGVGCAGRGIIRGLEVIRQLNLFEKYKVDLCIYDVLGDVVCGGFFEPIKRGGTNEIYIVTSGEFNSLFAANNICHGFLNAVSHSDRVKIGGIIGNMRGLPHERLVIETFADRTGIPLVGIIPRDMRIEKSTNCGCPLVLSEPSGELTKLFTSIAEAIFVGHSADKVNPFTFENLKSMQKEIIEHGYADD